jgi:RimJ/RimL family protein N-acetyltransferase
MRHADALGHHQRERQLEGATRNADAVETLLAPPTQGGARIRPRYPVELIDVLELRGGRRITVRPVLPQDGAALQAFVRNLSAESRRQRFLGGVSELSAALLERLTRIDYCSHLALVAEFFPDGVETVIAEARYAFEPGEDAAEFAVAVADEWQRLGLGTELLRRLWAHSVAAGIGRLNAVSLDTNQRMIRFAHKSGFTITRMGESPGLLRFRLESAPAAAGRLG